MLSGLEGEVLKQLEASSTALLAELKQAVCKGLPSCQIHGEVCEPLGTCHASVRSLRPCLPDERTSFRIECFLELKHPQSQHIDSKNMCQSLPNFHQSLKLYKAK